MLARLTEAIAKLDTNIRQIEADTERPGRGNIEVVVDVRDRAHLEKRPPGAARRCPGVLEVSRRMTGSGGRLDAPACTARVAAGTAARSVRAAGERGEHGLAGRRALNLAAPQAAGADADACARRRRRAPSRCAGSVPNVRAVTLWAWLTWRPVTVAFPQISHFLAMLGLL